jgi:restriction endonuclease S subunit
MKTTKDLKGIADVIAGYSFRTALQGKENASCFALQAKNILDGSIIDEDNLEGIDFENYRSKAVIEKNDIVVSSRGSFRAGLVGVSGKNIIASSSVYILRLKDKNIMPEYLTIYLNSSDGQKQLTESSTGATIKSIKKNDLENIEIIMPNLEKQKKIIEVYHTNNKLQEALIKKINLIKNINEVVINKLLKN